MGSAKETEIIDLVGIAIGSRPVFGQQKESPEICNLDPAEDHPSASKRVHPRELPLL